MEMFSFNHTLKSEQNNQLFYKKSHCFESTAQVLETKTVNSLYFQYHKTTKSILNIRTVHKTDDPTLFHHQNHEAHFTPRPPSQLNTYYNAERRSPRMGSLYDRMFY